MMKAKKIDDNYNDFIKFCLAAEVVEEHPFRYLRRKIPTDSSNFGRIDYMDLFTFKKKLVGFVRYMKRIEEENEDTLDCFLEMLRDHFQNMTMTTIISNVQVEATLESL